MVKPEDDIRDWRAKAQDSIRRGFAALEKGQVPYGNWEQLHLSAAIDDFCIEAFESSDQWARRLMEIEANRLPFPGGQFGHERSVKSLRADFEKLTEQVKAETGASKDDCEQWAIRNAAVSYC
jgi:hypothetical protein